jgi:predicted acyl esterase
VEVKPANAGGWLAYDRWPPASARRFVLSSDGLDGPGAPAGDWTHVLAAGVPSLADSGVPLISGALQGYLRLPVDVPLPLVSRRVAGVWTSAHLPGPTLLLGAPRLRLTVTSPADTTLFADLYDVDALDFGALITTKPYSVVGAAGQPTDVQFDLEPIAWSLPAGHRIALVVDTADLRYAGRARSGTQVTLSGRVADPSWLDLPIGG